MGLGARLVVNFSGDEPLCVEAPVTLFRVYLGMVTCFRARLCWGRGNVTFPGIGFPANTFISNVSMYFGATKK